MQQAHGARPAPAGAQPPVAVPEQLLDQPGADAGHPPGRELELVSQHNAFVMGFDAPLMTPEPHSRHRRTLGERMPRVERFQSNRHAAYRPRGLPG